MADSPIAAADGLVVVDVADDIAWITLNDPARRNCVSARLSVALAEVCEEIAGNSKIRVTVLTGAGSTFSAGGDIDSLTGRDQPLEVLYRGFRGLAALPVPVIAAVNGPAVGIGVTMQLAMDIRIASEAARFGFVFSQRGIVPEAASSWFLPRLVGISQALEWCYTGRVFPAQEALAGRLVSKVVPPDDLLRPRARSPRRSPPRPRRCRWP